MRWLRAKRRSPWATCTVGWGRGSEVPDGSGASGLSGASGASGALGASGAVARGAGVVEGTGSVAVGTGPSSGGTTSPRGRQERGVEADVAALELRHLRVGAPQPGQRAVVHVSVGRRRVLPQRL